MRPANRVTAEPMDASRNMNPNDRFSILALDSGGARGIYAAQVLARIERALDAKIKDCFDLIAGTSTGSILAGAAAAAIPMANIVELFEKESPRIFRKRWFIPGIAMLWRSKYSRRTLDDVLQQYVPRLTLGEVATPLLITSADLVTGGVHVFKSAYLAQLGEPYERDGEVFLRDAILASCAAPTFFDPKQVQSHLLVDGSLWANNPSIIALTEALSKFNRTIEDVRVLSIGTGHAPNMYHRRRSWVSLSSDSVRLNGKGICQSERLTAGSGDRRAPRLTGRLVGWVSERAYLRTVLRCTPS